MKKIFLLFTFALPFFFMACVNNDDNPDPVPPPDPLDPVTVDNIIGEWQVYWASKLIRLSETDPRTPIRDVSFDGFRVSIQKSGTDILYREFNANERSTADGKIIEFRGDTSMVFRGWVKIDTHENPDTTIIFRPYIKKANQYMEISSTYWAHTSQQTYQIIDRKLFRNQSNSTSKDTYPNIAKVPVDKSFLTAGGGKWEITSYIKVRRNAADNKLENLSQKERAEIDSLIYNSTTKSGAKFQFADNEDRTCRSWLPDGRETVSGTYRIYDDVIDYFFNKINDNGEPVEASSAFLVTGKVIATSPNTFTEQTYNYIISEEDRKLKIDSKSTAFKRLSE